MKYSDALLILNSCRNFEKKSDYSYDTDISLGPIRDVLRVLGNPESRLRIVLVAGTNGKGSTCAMLTAIFRQNGYCVGTYTSPHIADVRERIQINGMMIDKRVFTGIMERVQRRVGKVLLSRLTYFELLTVVAYEYFVLQQVDIAVMEVGMGGRLDATNVANPLVSVITPISMDHMQYLGHTLRKIAREKAGIIKPHGIVVSAKQDQCVQTILQKTARQCKAKLYWAKTKGLGFTPGLTGKHQEQNALLALKVCEIIQQTGVFSFTQKNSQRALQGVTIPGRLECVSHIPRIILDGAHNEAGMTVSLQACIPALALKKDVVVLFGIAKDKHVSRVVRVLDGYGLRVVLTQSSASRAINAQELSLHDWRLSDIIGYDQNLKNAFDVACDAAGDTGTVLVIGSFYLVADVKKVLESKL